MESLQASNNKQQGKQLISNIIIKQTNMKWVGSCFSGKHSVPDVYCVT